METFDWLDPSMVGIVLMAAASIFAAIFKSTLTPEKYAALAPRAAGAYKLLIAFLPDIIKAIRAVKQLKSGSPDVELRAPKPSSPPSLSVVRDE